MDEAKYIETQMQLAALVTIVRGMPLEEFVATIKSAETVGPFLDPTLMMVAYDKLRVVKSHAQAALDFKRAVGPVPV